MSFFESVSQNSVIISGASISTLGAVLSRSEVQPYGVASIAAGIGAVIVGQYSSFRELKHGELGEIPVLSQEQ